MFQHLFVSLGHTGRVVVVWTVLIAWLSARL